MITIKNATFLFKIFTEVSSIQKSVHWFAEQMQQSMDWFLFDKEFRHERVKSSNLNKI